MYNFMPVLAALSRVVLVFSVTFFVPWAWSWWGDEDRLQEVVWAWEQIKDSRNFRD